jgi:hypothetical protein
MTGLRINVHERRAILALIEHTTLTDKQIAALVGRGLWTVFHVRKAAGIPATNKGRRASGVAAEVPPPDAPPAPDIRSHWLARDPGLERTPTTWRHPYARSAS